jgi:hypothetical protein
MIVKIRIPRFATHGLSLGSTELATEPVRGGSTFHAALTDSAEDWVMRAGSVATFTPRPEVTKTRPAGSGPLARGWSWLHRKYKLTATKRLRVTETVSLGEKRFVSIVCVEDQEFLIGGGSAGVSLLAQLTPSGSFAGMGPKGARGDAE